MAFTDTILNGKIRTFLDKSHLHNLLGSLEKIELHELLAERDPRDNTVWIELGRQKARLIAWLGITKRTSQGGEVGKIDNLLVAINGFVLLFCLAALVPVFFLSWDRSWIIPVVLLCPFIHFLAHRLSRSPDINQARIKNMHLFAAMISIVPLACLATYLMPYIGAPVRKEVALGCVACLWVAHTLVVSLLVRTENAFYCSLFLVGFVANAAIFFGLENFSGTVCLNLLLGTVLLWIAGGARAGKYSLPAGRMCVIAGIFVCLAFAVLLLFLVTLPRMARGGYNVGLPMYALSLAFLPAVLGAEAARLSDNRLKDWFLALLPLTWLYFGLALLFGGAFGWRELRMGNLFPVLPYILLCVVLVWSLWFLYEQFMAENDFDTNIFSFAAMAFVICMATGYCLLAFQVGYAAALALAVLVFTGVFRLRGRYLMAVAKVVASEADAGSDEDVLSKPDA